MQLWLSTPKALSLFFVLSLVIFGLSVSPVSAALNYAQSEIDGNGIDDDGDGYTDSEDTESPSHYEGYGTTSTGGMGGTVYWVDCSLGDLDVALDAHAGTYVDPCGLRKACLQSGARVIKFVNGGTITLNSTIRLSAGNITIDGFSAPSPGVTITHTQANHGGISLSPAKGTHESNYIINHLRFDGLYDEYPSHTVGWALLTADADNYVIVDGQRVGSKLTDVILDHLTVMDLQDKTTLWGAVENVTFSNNLYYGCTLATLVSFYYGEFQGVPYDLLKNQISFHHNVWAENSQRNPQLRGWIRDFDYVNNVVFNYGWGNSWGYGVRIKNEVDQNEASIFGNFINNYWVANNAPTRALIYGIDDGWDSDESGPSSPLPQGSVYTESNMGELWVSGNVLPSANLDHYSTVSQARTVPSWAQVTTTGATDIYKTAWLVGANKFRQGRDQEVLDRVLAAITPDTRIVNTEVFYNNSAYDGNDSSANAADDSAIATDKELLLADSAATFANYTSYSKGINGIMIDIEGLSFTPDSSDFQFRVGNDSTPSGWPSAPAPVSVTRRIGAGFDGSDRVTIIWADNAIENQWLEITVNPTVGIAAQEVFYIGNAIGETGNSPLNAQVTPTDEVDVRNNPAALAVNPADVTDRYDFNRDRKVGPTDSILARNNGTNPSTALVLLSTVINDPPTVDAGTGILGTIGNPITLAGAASDDGNPFGSLVTTWSKVVGPGTVSFGDANALDSTATFSVVGLYTLQLHATDGELARTDLVQVSISDGSVTGYYDDFDDNDISDWTALVGGMTTVQFSTEPGYEVAPTVADSRSSKTIDNSGFADTVYISFKIRHTNTASGWKQGKLLLVDSSGAGFGVIFGLQQGDDGQIAIYETTDNGATGSMGSSFTAPGATSGTAKKTVELVYDRVGNSVECFYEGVSKGSVSVDASYADFNKLVLYLKTPYTDGGRIDFDEIRVANTPLGS